MGKKLTDKQIKEDRTSRIMNTVAQRASYYRANPHRFCSDYLFPDTPNFLKTFQKILIWAMVHSDSFCFNKVYFISRYKNSCKFCNFQTK